VRPSVVLIAGLAALPLLAVPPSAAAQSGFHPRWEIPGFDFRKDGAWRVRARRVAELRRQLIAQGRMSALNAPTLGGPAPSPTQVTGTVLVPALLFSYQGIDSAQFMRDTSQYTSVLFGDPAPGGNPYTLRTFYEQMSTVGASPALFSMLGKMIGWVRLDSAEVTYTGTPGTCSDNPFGTTNCNGIFSVAATKRMQDGMRLALSRVDGVIDFSQFDNNGPDLIPNSGDDDGYVDMMMFAHATRDGACGGTTNNHIWAHRFLLTTLGGGGGLIQSDYVTNDPANGGGFIRISDYFAQSALGGASACDTTQIMPIGTAAHEFGHALGLPDLYDTQGPTEGIGRWGLMGSGNFSTPPSPARMEAWSLNELGWVTVAPLTTTGTYSFGAAPVSDTAFVVDVQGTNTRSEYFLLENRQSSQADTALIANACRVWYQQQNPPPCDGGLLVWHVDGAIMNGGGNALNAGTIHGLALEEADGARDLWCPGAVPLACNRGDAGDPYPGTTGNTVLSFNTNPAAAKNLDGDFVGFALDSIRQIVPGGEMAFRLRFGGLTVVRASDTNAVISVDAVNYNIFRNLFDDGSTHSVSVADTQFSINNRTRWRWASWSDGQLRTHDITTSPSGGTITATLNRDFKLIATAGAGATISSSPPLNLAGDFVAEGNAVQLTAVPAAGVTFAGWSGDTTSRNAVINLPMGRPYTVTAVFVATADVVVHLLGPTAPLTPEQLQALDANGNNNGSFDVGDFLAWVKATGATLSAETMAGLAQQKGARP
jgi:M6 family metalloprotease-like protein